MKVFEVVCIDCGRDEQSTKEYPGYLCRHCRPEKGLWKEGYFTRDEMAELVAIRFKELKELQANSSCERGDKSV